MEKQAGGIDLMLGAAFSAPDIKTDMNKALRDTTSSVTKSMKPKPLEVKEDPMTESVKMSMYKRAAKDKNDDSTALPYILGGSIAGLAALNAVRNKSLSAPMKNITDGMKEFKMPVSKNPYIKTTMDVLRKIKVKSSSFRDAKDAYTIAYKTSNGMPIGSKLSTDDAKYIDASFGSHYKSMMNWSKQMNTEFRQAQEIKPGVKFSKAEDVEFKKFVKNKVDSVNPSTPLFGGVKPNLNAKKPSKFADLDSDILKGMGMGTGVSAASILMHSMGDEYFKKKDNNEVREKIRNSYNSGDKKYEGYSSADNRIKNMSPRSDSRSGNYNSRNGRPDNRNGNYNNRNGRPDNRNGNYNNRSGNYSNRSGRPDNRNNFEKRASFKTPNQVYDEIMENLITHKDNGQLGDRAKKTLMEYGTKPFIDGSAAIGVPVAMTMATGRDIRNGFVAKDETDQTKNQIVVDIPNNLTKSASIRSKMDDIKYLISKSDGSKKVIDEDNPYTNFDSSEFWKARRKNAIGALPWSIGAGIASAALNKANGVGGSKKEETPVAPGYSRIIIQNGTTEDNSGDLDYRRSISKRGSEDPLYAIKEKLRQLLEGKSTRQKMDANDKLTGMDMQDNLKRTAQLESKEPLIGMEA